MKGVLLRVGCDQTEAGGRWNAPVDTRTWRYAYVPIPGGEEKHAHLSACPTYEEFEGSVAAMGVELPAHLGPTRRAHLDPDFVSTSFGEPWNKDDDSSRDKDHLSSRGRVLLKLDPGDFIAFFAGFRPTAAGYPTRLAYCLFGIFVVQRLTRVGELSSAEGAPCAQGRRVGSERDSR